MEATSSATQPANENVKAEDYLNMDNKVETKADVKEVNEFNENHQQSKEEEEEEDGTSQQQSECKLWTYQCLNMTLYQKVPRLLLL
jgi:hypothetical protein